MKNIKYITLLLLFFCKYTSAQYVDSTFKVTYKNNKLYVNNQHPYNLWFVNQRDYFFDISDTSLLGQVISFSFTNDAFQNNLPNISGYYQKKGKEGEAKSYIKINIPFKDIYPNPISVIYLYNEKKEKNGNKIYFSNYKNENFSFFNNRMYLKYNLTQQFDNKLGDYLNKNVPFAGNEEIGLYVDLNNDKNLDLIFATDQLFHKGAKFNTGKLMIPIYFTIEHKNELEEPLRIKITNEDLSSPNSKPKTLLHNWDIKSEIDLDGDGMKELINWGEHYHVESNPLWKDVASQLGLIKDIDYGSSNGNQTFYDSVFYNRRFRYYKIDSNRLIDKKDLIPEYNQLTGSFFGSSGDVDKDGDNDIVLKSNRGLGIILYNDGKGLFNTSKDLAEIPRVYFNEGFTRSDAYHYPYLVDMNNDGYQDWIVSLAAPSPNTPIRLIYYPNKSGTFDIANPVDIFPYNSNYNADNFLSYGVIQVKQADLNNDGKIEIIFLFAHQSNQDYLKILPRNIFKIISISNNELIDVTSEYFSKDLNIIETGTTMKGFNIIDVNNDGYLDLVPRFEIYNPKFHNWFPEGSWRGYWNNKTDFQYFESNGKLFEIKSLGKFIKYEGNTNDIDPQKLSEGEGILNMIELVDLNRDGNLELFHYFQGQGILNKNINDFSLKSKEIEIKDNTGIGTFLTSLKIDGYDSSKIEFYNVDTTFKDLITIKNKNELYLNTSLYNYDKKNITLNIKYIHTTLNISGMGYLKINILPSLPNKSNINSINSDTSNNIKICIKPPLLFNLKIDSLENIEKFILNISSDSTFKTFKNYESIISNFKIENITPGKYYIRSKNLNKNGEGEFSYIKYIVIDSFPSSPPEYIFNFCKDNLPKQLNITPSIGNDIYWYESMTALNNINTNNLSVTINEAGVKYLFISQVNKFSGCESPRTKITIKVNPIPDKPKFNTTKFSFCSGDSLKLSITNVNKGDTLKWYFGTKSDITNVANKTFTDSSKVFVTRTDSLGCMISSDTIQLKKYAIPSSPSLARDTANNLVASINGITWYKDGVKITDTTQKIKPTTNGIYTATTTQNGCTSALSQGYYYITNGVANLTNGEYFKISPNPTSGELNINYKISSSKNVSISVFDMNGRAVLLNKKVESGSKINLGSVSEGNYIIQAKDGSGRLISSQKLVKE